MKPKQSPTRRFYIILIMILMVVGSCASRRGEFICGNYELTEAEKIKSEITYYKIDSSRDSQFCNVHGVVTMAFKEEDKIVIENLSHTKILFNNKIANTYSGVISDSTGSFNAKIKEGLYDISFRYISFNQIIIRNVQLYKSESIEIKAKMGRENDTTEYVISQHNQIEEVTK